MRRRLITIAIGIIATAVLAGAGIAWTTSDNEQPLAGATREHAIAAALRQTGGGTVSETEAGDDGAAYSVEIRLANGRHVEVRLDERFQVIGQERDDDGPADTHEHGDD
jgi:hypothetical protein